MSNKELQRQVEAMRRLRKQVCASKETAREFLVKTGIGTKSGKLAKAYK